MPHQTLSFRPIDACLVRYNVQTAAEESVSQVELFLNSVPLLSSLSYQQKVELVHAFAEEHFPGETGALYDGHIRVGAG